MRRLLTFLTMLSMVMVLAISSGARASAPIACADAERTIAADLHFEGDADEVPADEDGAYPHHHGVGHDHQVGVSQADGAVRHRPGSRARLLPGRHDRIVGVVADPALRPPRA